ncbi:hypothetical protein WMF28_42815 [Sorangium sp. So ce590]|uniref:NACHT domain-containing protein n=1 Tax=Sorangium sp. So ce590 TaxID=3133317 RepID=UPI003F63E3EB
MNNTWELSKLDTVTFEHLVNALALKVLGAGVTGFGPGADAGRDGYFEGKAPYPSVSQSWKGIWYIQSKFHSPNLTKDAQAWVLEQLKLELEKFRDPRSGRQWPDNWIFATNVDISAGKNGAFDKARKLVASAQPELAKRFHIWGGKKIVDFLGQNQAVAIRYGHFLTPGHVLSALIENLNDDRATVEQIVRALVLQGIKDHRRTRIEQAGSREDQPPGIETLFVDLPFIDPKRKISGDALETLTHAAAQCHRSDETYKWDDEWHRWRSHPRRAAVWFVRAGPGRGKSTIGQFFCQVQRAALLAYDPTFKRRPEVDEIVNQVQMAAEKLGVWPKYPRIPIWVELKSYAAWFAEQPTRDPKGVLSWLAADLRRTIELKVPVGTIQRALRQRSWAVVFDGLDEVPSIIKDDIAHEVVRFVEESSLDSDLMTLCTSRPQGYSGQFDALGGAVVELIDLDPDRALECANRVARIGRTETEADAARAVLEGSLRTPAVREIMTTPLQAHIMAVLVRNGARPPERKWDLYDSFYKVIREREANRDLPDPRLRALLQGDPRIIDGVHQRLGFLLHAKAETAAGAEASLSKSEFRKLVRNVVQHFGTPGDLDHMVDVVLLAATDRLVLINTPDNGSHVRFDVRAIQEFFAAEFMYEDVESQELRARLEVIAGDSHWREVVQFLLGALVSTRRRTERTIAFDVLRSLDQGRDEIAHRPLARLLGVGAMHAALLLINGVAENDQQIRTQLRDVLEPISVTGDWSVLRSMRGLQSTQTLAWLWGWAKEQARTKSSTEVQGAVSMLALLCHKNQPDEADVIAFGSSLPTDILAQFVDELLIQRQMDDNKLKEWERRIVGILFDREDLIRKAPGFVGRVIGENTTARESSLRNGVMKKVGSIARVDGIFRVRIQGYGVLVVNTISLSSTGREILTKYSRTGKGATPLLRWLTRLMASSVAPTVAGARELLAEVGDTWYPIDVLPDELTRGIPIPVATWDLRPDAFADLLDGMTDDEFASGLASRCVAGVILSNSGTNVSIVKTGNYLENADRLAFAHPEIFLRYVAFAFRSNAQPDERVRNLAIRTLVQRPEYVSCVHAQHLLQLLENADPVFRQVLLQTGPKVRLECLWGETKAPSVDISMPNDRGLIVLMTNAILSEILMRIDGRAGLSAGGTVDESSSSRESTARVFPDLVSLLSVAEEPTASLDMRSSGVLLAALHPSGGFDILLRYKGQLIAWAASGVAVAPAVALIVEAIHAAERPEMSGLLSALLDADPVHRYSHVLVMVVHRWRERSRAPVTAGRHIDVWMS